jgi:hypothetical protein
MPLEIRELHIKVTVNEPLQGQQPAAPAADPVKSDEEKQSIIRQCVDEVLEILNNKTER